MLKKLFKAVKNKLLRKKHHYVIHFFDSNHKLTEQILVTCYLCDTKKIIKEAQNKISENPHYCFFDIKDIGELEHK